MSRKLQLLFLILFFSLPNSIYGDSNENIGPQSSENVLNSELSFFVLSDPIDNYTAIGCGDSFHNPCNSIQDAIYAFQNKTFFQSNDSNSQVVTLSTPFVLNLFGNTHFKSRTVSLDHLNIKFQSYYSNQVTIEGFPIPVESNFTKEPLFTVEFTDYTNIVFKNIIFSSFESSVVKVFFSNSSILFEKCTFVENTFNTGDGLIDYRSTSSRENKLISFINCLYVGQKGILGSITINNAKLFIFNSTFGSNKNLGFVLKNSDLIIDGSSFSANNIYKQSNGMLQGLFECENCYVTITGSEFINHELDVSLLYFKNGRVDISKSKILNNRNYIYYGDYIPGGLIFAQDLDMRIANSDFNSNTANYSILYSSGCQINIESGHFIDNQSFNKTIISIKDSEAFYKETIIRSSNPQNNIISISNSKATIDQSTILISKSLSKISAIECERSELFFIDSSIENYDNDENLVCNTGCLSYSKGNSTFTTVKRGKIQSSNSLLCPPKVRKLNGGAIAAIIVCVTAFIVIVVGVVFILKRKNIFIKQNYGQLSDDETPK
ncbi:hypothetical protein CYY_000336 [Polysphondylium violaceum]|uniref:Right handed beta helix domain-containing protein n=1 Tax=Polysphondylium violaceum TaxID=133409 RepID=A0A8J4Q3Z1_9MYCE|nr:hypothetical protein CYY_000336 [Polysphondylium violaceum]